MAGGKETPRQKMIGMMYLVLTALLAMNVSKDILKAFVTVNESLERTNKNFSENTLRLMLAFEEAQKTEARAVPYYKKAIEAKKLTQELYDHMEKLKHAIIAEVYDDPGGDTMRLRYLEAKDNYDIPTHQLIGDDERQPVKGQFTAAELKEKIQMVHDKLIKLVQDMQKNKKTYLQEADYNALLSKIGTMQPAANGEVEDDVPVSWEVLNFYHLPTAGVITNISKMQADLKNIESEIVGQLAGAAGKMRIRFNKLNAEVVAASSYVQSGEAYTADIFLAASSNEFKEDNLQVILNPVSYDTATGKVEGGTPVPLVDGVGKLSEVKGVGDQNYNGVIRLKEGNGEFKLYPFERKYTVAAPSVAVSPEKMNVFYIGVDNPIAVSAAGIAPANLQVAGIGGGIRVRPNGAGKYIVTATSPTTDASISVAARMQDGTTKQQGSCKFRVRSLPDPVASAGGKKGYADITRLDVSGIGAVAARLENFEFETKFVVTQFDLTAIIQGQPVFFQTTGPALTPAMKKALGKARTGSKIYIDNVKAIGPDGKTRPIPGVTLKVKG